MTHTPFVSSPCPATTIVFVSQNLFYGQLPRRRTFLYRLAGLTRLYETKDLTKAELARRSGISEVYLHQVFAGRRNPSRDRLLCICVGLGITLDETQRMLTQGGYAQLYPRTRRDAIISYGVVHQLPLGEINDKLFAEQEKTLF